MEVGVLPGFLWGVRKSAVFVKYWLPVLIWFVLIFTASRDSDSFNRSSRIIGPLVHWLWPSLGEHQVDHVVFLVRKLAHVTEYAVLAWLFWRAFRHALAAPKDSWSIRAALLAWTFATLYAFTDEWHQIFVPNRQGSFWDVTLDSTGAAIGLLLVWALGRWRRVW